MKVEVVDITNKKVGDAELIPAVFEAKINKALVYDAVMWQMAKRRAGTHSAKIRDEVRGGGKKPWKQKGTGRARAGSTRSPVWRGGGIVFGPKPRDYEHAMPKKARRGALISALSAKLLEKAITVLADMTIESPKTKMAAQILTSLGLLGHKTLIVVDKADSNTSLSFRNIPKVRVLPVEGMNVYDVVDAESLVITSGALGRIQERLAAK
jgi:large subunit ribosomal protein L4